MWVPRFLLPLTLACTSGAHSPSITWGALLSCLPWHPSRQGPHPARRPCPNWPPNSPSPFKPPTSKEQWWLEMGILYSGSQCSFSLLSSRPSFSSGFLIHWAYLWQLLPQPQTCVIINAMVATAWHVISYFCWRNQIAPCSPAHLPPPTVRASHRLSSVAFLDPPAAGLAGHRADSGLLVHLNP